MNLPETPLFILRFDGSCPLNPGPMGIGYTLSRAGDMSGPLVRVGGWAGHGTNNKAEYLALIAGLRHALRLGMFRLEIYSDSLLVVNQLKGRWKVRDRGLRRPWIEATYLLDLFKYPPQFFHVYREHNDEADKLSRSLEFAEPTLPVPAKRGRALLNFQAAAIREWWGRGRRNTYLLGRLFDILPVTAEQIGNGTSYKGVTFDDMPEFARIANPPAPSPGLGEQESVYGNLSSVKRI